MEVDSSATEATAPAWQDLVGLAGIDRPPLRPEIAAVLGGWPLSQLTASVGDSSGLLLSRVVTVLRCCIVTARSVQGMARVRSGQAPARPSD